MQKRSASLFARSIAVIIVTMAIAGTVEWGVAKGGRALTKKRATRLFYPRAEADRIFYPRAEADRIFLPRDEAATGYASCTGRSWHSTGDDETAGGLNNWALVDVGFPTCSLSLPHGALVKRVRVLVLDAAANSAIEDCGIHRFTTMFPLGNSLEMVTPGTTESGVPGDVELASAPGAQLEIDNQTWSYELYCFISLTSANVGVYTGAVEYEVTRAEGAAA